MKNGFTLIAALNGFMAVLCGALGAHALKSQLGEKALVTWQTAVEYHFYHTLALLLVSVLLMQGANRSARWLLSSGWLFIAGMVLFSGALYVYALSGVVLFAHVAPFGGLSLMLGWLVLAVAALKNIRSER